MAQSIRKVLVTGADGFIGSHLVEELVCQGYQVKAFVLYNSFNSWGWLDTIPDRLKSEIEIFAGDIRDPSGVKTALKGCDGVLHLAALIGIPYSYHSPSSYVDTNIKGTLNILQAAREWEVERVIHTSTSEVYGTAVTVPITEEHRLQGQSPYAASKIGADHLALSYFRSFALPVTVIRPFNTYGPRQSARAVIPTIILQLLAGLSEIRLGSIHPTRDLNFVRDTVAGFVAALKAERVVGEVINLGSNYEISVGNLASMIAELMELEVRFVTDAERLRPKDSEVERLWAANAKARELLGWQPQWAGAEGLKQGLRETIAWFRDHQQQGFYKASYTI